MDTVLIRCIELLLDVCQYQQNLLHELAENQGIILGSAIDEKLNEIRKEIDSG